MSTPPAKISTMDELIAALQSGQDGSYLVMREPGHPLDDFLAKEASDDEPPTQKTALGGRPQTTDDDHVGRNAETLGWLFPGVNADEQAGRDDRATD